MSVKDGHSVFSKAAKDGSTNDAFCFASPSLSGNGAALSPAEDMNNLFLSDVHEACPPGDGGPPHTPSFPFTNAQWKELERQAMIYKYLMSAVPVPPSLLFPHYFYNGGDCSTRTMTDLDRGRCKRTDGKKWRCSRDAAPDQKYCERHLHRGRPRSRKPVELLSSDSTAKTVTVTDPLNAKKTRLLSASPSFGTGYLVPSTHLSASSSFSLAQTSPVTEECTQPRMEINYDNLFRQYGWLETSPDNADCFFPGVFQTEAEIGRIASEFYDPPAAITPGGPLAEVLYLSSSSSVAESAGEFGISPSGTAASSPSGAAAPRSFFSFSDSSGNSSPIPVSSSSDVALLWLDQTRGNLASII